MKTIGIPRALLYYRYKVLWENFFKFLDVKIVTSSKSNVEILNNGKKIAIDEACLSLKLFIGHVNELKDKCDLILIPRIYSLEKRMQVCTNFNCLYDLIKNLFTDKKILGYNIDVNKGITEEKSLVKLGCQLGFKKAKVKEAYYKAKKEELISKEKIKIDLEKKLLSKNKKILLLGHSYNLEDDLIGKPITKFFKDNNVEIIYSYQMPDNLVNKYVNKISPKVHWTMNKELLASFAYFKDKVDGVIIISSFPCGPDSLTNEMILRKKQNCKVILLTFEDLNSDVAVQTRLESFLDMLNGGVFV